MPKWSEEKIRLRKLLEAPIPDDEPCTRMRFPRRDAAKRVKNVEKRRRIVFPADEVTYSEFHREKERVLRQLDDNPVLFGVFLTDVLKGFTDGLVAQWRNIHESAAQPEDMGSLADA